MSHSLVVFYCLVSMLFHISSIIVTPTDPKFGIKCTMFFWINNNLASHVKLYGSLCTVCYLAKPCAEN